ncbi:thioether cross-link-forming SCIFF peptide maturase [Anaerocolumna cellulosilytica]|uniref:Thioether cross-link-forming SCIFF peptide maturase n=1 Tax=Anaerocolumna cellulosilytica TaxID=433286 RepID=A0A6S6QU21_9FIRM|nr:radical SAM protein [Anaerocolumna cellulosilytica]MBB5193983.1 sulfatase maturation enzyme AslB (radical SAM superfamily) [Anaerocolumna cellulosilytica]BCJ94803.1 thioether cross-link-forming SCIFF peptide maturase [Anaerocolumna cellulosilytica]
MYTLSLEVVNQCNLNCKYCYLGEKKNRKMPKDTAKSAMDLSIHEARKQRDKTLVIYFIGGEPMLAFELIEFCVDYASKKGLESGLSILFSTTTNGTLLDQEKVRFLIQHNFDLKVSIDGTEEVHNLNREYYHHKGSYKDIISKLPLIWEYEKKTEKICHVANVITTNNCNSLYENMLHLTDLGFKIVESTINIYSTWSEEDFNRLCVQMEKAFVFYSNIRRHGKNIYWKYFEDRISNLFTLSHFFGCKAGLISIYVTVDGIIYPCTEIDEMVKVGDVSEGLDVDKIRSFVKLNCSTNESCIKCSEFTHCRVCGCIMNNYEVHRDFYKPITINCNMTKFIFNLLRSNLSSTQQEAFKQYYQKRSIGHV